MDKREQLRTPLLSQSPSPPPHSQGLEEDLRTSEVTASSSHSIDSSRRTMNRSTEEERERLFSQGGLIVELSNAGSEPRADRSLSDSGDSIEKVGEEVQEEAEADGSAEELLLGGRHATDLILNHSSGHIYRTLPRPYNPGNYCKGTSRAYI